MSAKRSFADIIFSFRKMIAVSSSSLDDCDFIFFKKLRLEILERFWNCSKFIYSISYLLRLLCSRDTSGQQTSKGTENAENRTYSAELFHLQFPRSIFPINICRSCADYSLPWKNALLLCSLSSAFSLSLLTVTGHWYSYWNLCLLSCFFYNADI